MIITACVGPFLVLVSSSVSAGSLSYVRQLMVSGTMVEVTCTPIALRNSPLAWSTNGDGPEELLSAMPKEAPVAL